MGIRKNQRLPGNWAVIGALQVKRCNHIGHTSYTMKSY